MIVERQHFQTLIPNHYFSANNHYAVIMLVITEGFFWGGVLILGFFFFFCRLVFVINISIFLLSFKWTASKNWPFHKSKSIIISAWGRAHHLEEQVQRGKACCFLCFKGIFFFLIFFFRFLFLACINTTTKQPTKVFILWKKTKMSQPDLKCLIQPIWLLVSIWIVVYLRLLQILKNLS